MYKRVIRPVLFSFSPETAHHLAITTLKTIQKIPFSLSLLRHFFCLKNSQPIQQFGLSFRNPIGLAAGFDKNGEIIPALASLGFGFVEIGTITPRPQAGNSKPRLFRRPSAGAVINRMGLNNQGVDMVVKRLRNRPKSIILGANIGKNTNSHGENARIDFIECFNKLCPFVDYFTLNLSCPNVGKMGLQDPNFLIPLLDELAKINGKNGLPMRPILLKVSPDSSLENLDVIVKLVKHYQLAGIIATNTSTDHRLLAYEQGESGGISGKPLYEKSNQVLAYLAQQTQGEFSLVGLGGIDSLPTAQQKMQLGADLIQVYTGWIFEGMGLIRQLQKGLSSKQ